MWASMHSGIQTQRRLREQETTTCRLSSMEIGACGVMRRPAFRRSGTRKQDERAATVASRAVMACNTVKRPFNSINNPGSTMGERDLCIERRMVGHENSSVVNSAGGSAEVSFCNERTFFAADSVNALDDRGYDPEALLLEPLLPSPRSNKERENRAGVVDVTSGNGVCENVLSDGHMMAHSGNNGEPVNLGTGWDEQNSNTALASHHQHNQQSSRISGLLGQTLVPVSPANSGAQATASFVPGETRPPPPASAGSNSNGNGGVWHLKLPSHAQHGTTAEAVAAAAANVAAAIQQASMQFTPNYPPVTQQMSMYMSMSANTSPVAVGSSSGRILTGVDCSNMVNDAGGGNGGGTACYNYEDSRRSWQSIGPQADGQMRRADDVSATAGNVGNGAGVGNRMGGGIAAGGGGSSRSDDALAHRPRFVTREECLPGAHSTHNIPQSRGESPWSVASGGGVDEAQVTATKGTHVILRLDASAYSRSGAEGDYAATVGTSEPMQDWQHSMARRGVKRLHPQSSGTPSPLPTSVSAAADAMDSMDRTSSLRGPTGDISAALAQEEEPRMSPSSSTMASSGLRIQTGVGGGSIPEKRIKVRGTADGSRSWGSIARGSSSSGDAIGNGVVGEQDGWGTGSDTSRTTSSITPEDLHRVSPCHISDSATPRRRSTRCMAGVGAGAAGSSSSSSSYSGVSSNGSSVPHMKQDETTEEDDDSAVGAGELSPDWHEREESEEESSKSTSKTKVPFKLDPRLWVIVERRAVCSAKQCAYRSEDDHRARRRHYHALCSHVHQNGERKGMRFQHHQLEKVQKHQRAHQVSAKQNSQRASVVKHRSPSGSPVPRSKRSSSVQGLREQSKAIKEANLEAHSPKDWTPELTKRLRDLVDELGPKWSVIAEKIPGKSATACMLHWRVGLNPNHMVKGSGTWTAEEDERLSKLVEVVGMKWSDLARHIPGRIAKQCRERYLNHLDPSLRKDMPWTEDEEALLMRLCFAKQNQWAEICRQLHGRSYNDVKNRFNLIQRRNKRASLNPGGQNKHGESSSAGRPPTAAPGASTIGDHDSKRGRNPNRAGNGIGCAEDSGNGCVNGDINEREGTCTIGVGDGCVRSTPELDKASKDIALANAPFPSNGNDDSSFQGLKTRRDGAADGTSANVLGSEDISPSGVSPVLDASSSAAGCSDERLIAAATAATVSAAGGWSAAAAAVAAADAAAAARGAFGKPLTSCGITAMSTTASATSSGCSNGGSLLGSPSTPSSALTPGRPTQRNEGGGHRRGGSVTGVSATVTASSGNSMSNGSSFSLMGDELGEFGLGEGEFTGPGSGFAPGGYWHQMVKEEARVGREFDGDYVDGTGGGNSVPLGSSALLPSPNLTSLMDMEVGEEGEGGVRLPPPPPLDGEETTTVLDKQQRWEGAQDAGAGGNGGFAAQVTTGATPSAMDVVSGEPGSATPMS